MIGIHGYYHTQNYGDQLMLNMLARHVRSATGHVPLCPQVHPRQRDLIDAAAGRGFREFLGLDACIFGGGGSLADTRGWRRQRRVWRYTAPALLMRARRRPTGIVSVECGPHVVGPARRAVGALCGGAEFVVARNPESAAELRALGVDPARVHEGADMVCALRREDLPARAVEAARTLFAGCPRPRVCLHAGGPPESVAACERILPRVAREARARGASFVLMLEPGAPAERWAKLAEDAGVERPTVVQDIDSWLIAAQLSEIDAIITTKLHVGVTVWAFGGAPFGYSIMEKSRRFYSLVGLAGNQVDAADPDPPVERWVAGAVGGDESVRTGDAKRAEVVALASRSFEMITGLLAEHGLSAN